MRVPDVTESDDVERHKAIYREASQLIDREINLAGKHSRRRLGFAGRHNLVRAARMFEQVLAFDPDHWPAMWSLGKIYQRLGNNEIAFKWFTDAYEHEPGNPDVAREASLAAMEIGRPSEAVDLASAAERIKPGDPGLKANSALAILLAGNPLKAKQKAVEASEADPDDPITKHLVRVIDDVLANKRPAPRTVSEIG